MTATWRPARTTVIDFVKRYYWGLNLIVIGTSAYFAARATLHVVEAKYLLGEGPQKAAVRRLPPPAPKVAHSKETRAILERNMFCSDCPPIIPKDKTSEKDGHEGQEIKSNLPLMLVATMISNDPEWSFAVIKDTQGREVEDDKGQKVKAFPFAMYSRGRKVAPHDAIVDHVEERRVYLKVADHVEYIDLQGTGGQDKTLASTRPPAGPAAGLGTTDYKRGVRKVSETQYEIDRNLLEKVLSDTNAIARSARVVPSVSPKDGKPNGFKLYAIRPDSVYSTIGLQNGDTVSAINGQEINSPEKAFELYAKLRTASGLQISIIRRGQPLTIDYSIR